jgi:phospholipid/cholesterol/gamma-HCH transport system substrate-binding protein
MQGEKYYLRTFRRRNSVRSAPTFTTSFFVITDMKLSNETKVGILGVVALVVLVYGYNYLRGRDLFNKKMVVYAVYDRSDGLTVSAPVRMNGFQVGVVTDLQPQVVNGAMTGKLQATFGLDRNVRIPKSAVARIYQPSMMMGMEVALLFQGDCSGGDCLEEGDILKGEAAGGFFGDIGNAIRPLLGDLRNQLTMAMDAGVLKLDSVVASTLPEVSEQGIGGAMRNIRGTLENLRKLTATLDQTLAKASPDVISTLDDVSKITQQLRENSAKLNAIIANAESISQTINTQTMGKVNGALDHVNDLSGSLKGTIEEVNAALAGIKQVLAKAQSDDNTLGMLLNDEQFARELETTVSHARLLLQDIRMSPERYRTILSKKKKPYQAHPDDPGLREQNEQ